MRTFFWKKNKNTECLSLSLYMLAISGENKTSPLEISQNSQQDPCLEIPHYFSLITCGEVPPLVLELPHTCSFFIQYPWKVCVFNFPVWIFLDCWIAHLEKVNPMKLKFSALLHFRTPHIVIDDSSWKNAAESFTEP